MEAPEIPTVETERLHLRGIRGSDFEDYAAVVPGDLLGLFGQARVLTPQALQESTLARRFSSASERSPARPRARARSDHKRITPPLPSRDETNAGSRTYGRADMHRQHSFWKLLLLCFAAAAGAASQLAADSSQTRERTITQLADGVYEIRHPDPLPGWVNGNTLVVIGTRSVFVVDACNVAWEAKADIAQIRKWTRLPVRYLLNTHWHHDHNAGNGAYLEAFPGADILATSETKRRMDANASSLATQILASAEQTGKQLANSLASGKGADGQPLSEERKERARRMLAQVGEVKADARAWVNRSPTLTFDDQLTIDLGDREVRITFLGRGNTGGDAIAYLPKEKILATGDLVVHPVPFTFDGYPKEWVHTLERLAALRPDTIVPGHGEVLHDSRYILQLRDLFGMIVERVEAALDQNPEIPLEDVKKMFDLSAQRAAILGDDEADSAFFHVAMDSFIELAFREAKQR